MSDTMLLTLGYVLVPILYGAYWVSLKMRIGKSSRRNGK